jgi:hypothetical protein
MKERLRFDFVFEGWLLVGSHTLASSPAQIHPEFFPDRHPRRSKPGRRKPEARKKRVRPFLKSPNDLRQLKAHGKSSGRLIRARTWPYV